MNAPAVVLRRADGAVSLERLVFDDDAVDVLLQVLQVLQVLVGAGRW